VTGEFLNRPRWCPTHRQMRAERVPEAMNTVLVEVSTASCAFHEMFSRRPPRDTNRLPDRPRAVIASGGVLEELSPVA